MENITITNLNKIISDFRKKLEISREENISLKSKIKSLEEQLKKRK